MQWVWRWSARSNERAVANARAASTLLSRRRVERQDVELYLQQRYGDPVALDARAAGAGR